MTLAAVHWLKVQAKGLPTFECDACGARALGETVESNLELVGASAFDVGTHLARERVSNHRMPAGWSSRYAPKGDEHLCPECSK